MMAMDVKLKIALVVMAIVDRYICHGLAVAYPGFGPRVPGKCRLHENDVRLHGLSWKQCLRSCNDRTQCLAVSYRRSVHMCVLNYDASGSDVLAVCPGYDSAMKQLEHEDGSTCSCPDFKVCTDVSNGVCSIEECKPLVVSGSGRIHGNMAYLGSKVKVACDTDFIRKGAEYLVCNDNGEWINATGQTTDTPTCIAETPVFNTATQTSVSWEGVAQYAIDGDTSRDYSQMSCTATDVEERASWTGHLETTSFVRKVVVYNRSDCCPDRLNDFSVFVGSQLCAHFQGSAPQIIELICVSDKLVGDSITIQQNQPYIILTMCEVQAF